MAEVVGSSPSPGILTETIIKQNPFVKSYSFIKSLLHTSVAANLLLAFFAFKRKDP